MWYVYLLECEDGSFYCGISTDVERRFQAHRTGRGAKYTKSHVPVRIAYQEAVGTHGEALSREYVLKKLTHQQKMELIERGLRISEPLVFKNQLKLEKLQCSRS